MLNESFESATLPSLWLHANITPLHKKDGRLESANYRPISLTLILCKIRETFDTVPHERLCIKLVGYGIIGDLLNWCRAFLKNRIQQVILGENITEWTNVISSVLQRSVLGPLLFILYINDIMLNIKNECKLYADDTKIISILDHNSSTVNLQEDLNKMVQWTKNCLIEFNNDKYKVIHIG
ncbi:uncharacterized protein LOC136096719 [Hydra vulgaris]|uniref:uncharacterized protein LOC136096719 n=1 Tax=Hydra vulgaris TaxID=6087 RepID=UPI0032EA5094